MKDRISGEPAVYDPSRSRRNRHHGLIAGRGDADAGGATLHGPLLRLARVRTQGLPPLVASMNGSPHVVPSTVGKVIPMGTPEDEWRWCVEGLKECQAHAEEVGVRIGVEPLNRFETYFINRADQAVQLAKDVGGNCGATLDIFHMNIEEADWRQAIAQPAPPRRLPRRRQQPHASGRGRSLGGIVSELARSTTLVLTRVRRDRRRSRCRARRDLGRVRAGASQGREHFYATRTGGCPEATTTSTGRIRSPPATAIGALF